jgi:hypothetical protein
MEQPSDHESEGVLETDLEEQEIDWADIRKLDEESNAGEEMQVEGEEIDDEDPDDDEDDDDDEEEDEWEPVSLWSQCVCVEDSSNSYRFMSFRKTKP